MRYTVDKASLRKQRITQPFSIACNKTRHAERPKMLSRTHCACVWLEAGCHDSRPDLICFTVRAILSRTYVVSVPFRLHFYPFLRLSFARSSLFLFISSLSSSFIPFPLALFSILSSFFLPPPPFSTTPSNSQTIE
jgi:hypothetical protein